MGLFRSERTVERWAPIKKGDPLYGRGAETLQPVTETYLNGRGKAAIWLAAAAMGFGIFSDEGLGAATTIWGHGTIGRSDKSMNDEAHAKYALALRQASPAQLFELRYTDHATLSVNRIAAEGTGLASFGGSNLDDHPDRIYSVGDGCLNDTAYDINGGRLQFTVDYSGLFSSVYAHASGDVPTAAAQAYYNPSDHELVIKSGNARSDNLQFLVNGTHLTPEDSTTTNILETYGCKAGPEYTYTYSTSASY